VVNTLDSGQITALASLAITERCCIDDLGVDPELSLSEIADTHSLVEKFIALRIGRPIGQETIQSLRGAFPVFSLHSGRERGATAADSDHDVVWLLASGKHRAGDRSDAYMHFERLLKRGELFPAAADYERLFRRRNAETIPLLLSRVASTYAQAHEHPGESHTVLLPKGLAMTLFVEPLADEDLMQVERLWLALDARALPRRWLPLIQAACTPGAADRPWEYSTDFPGRPPNRGELRFKCWYEVQG
jgi:hypothetical protein